MLSGLRDDRWSAVTRFTRLTMGKTMKRTEPQLIDMEARQLQDMLRRAERREFIDEDYETVRVLAQSYAYLTDVVQGKEISTRRLRKLLFGAKTEKTADVLVGVGDAESSSEESSEESSKESSGESSGSGSESQGRASGSSRKGHGRNGAAAYTGAEQVEVPHASLQPGDPCPACLRGTLYETGRPRVLLRLTGQSPIDATVYRLQQLRCNPCGKLYTANPPPGVGAEKYDAATVVMIALLKYGHGMPMYRLDGLQQSLGIPLPASTQWDILQGQARQFQPVWDELLNQAAQSEVQYNDDTTVRILEHMGERARQRALAETADDNSGEKEPASRKGLFTSGIVSTGGGWRIALFFSGHRHAGENLSEVLRRRAKELAPPIQMCDALSRNLPGELETILANCLAHARRRFVDVVENFPEPCRYVLEALKVVYHNDAVARGRKLSPAGRLQLHQRESGPTMDRLHAWLTERFDRRLVEPNSSLGGAVGYMLKHWDRLTLFLRKPGAPLDNNICEQALKKAILHRKNALFYKTDNGARVGDLYMSLIHTCQLNRVNPFDYLTALARHAEEAARSPACWMPWNYRQSLPAP